MVTYWARLSEREKALLHSGQTYGRSCVWVRTCLSARVSVYAKQEKNSGEMRNQVMRK